MDPRGAEPGTELVLDNRKLIVGFLLLIAVCGAFFVIGFMEGKRQAVKVVAQPDSPPASNAAVLPIAPEPRTANTSAQPAAGKPDSSVRDQLDWYKNVQSGKSPTKVVDVNKTAAIPETVTPVKTNESPKKPAAAPVTKNPAAAKATKISYWLQAGAFMQRHEAELKADELKSKGITCVVDEPKPPDPFYRVKVGSFDTRAEAVAMQRKLEKSGFRFIIKTK
jgi:cell division protein FtsN